MTNWSQSDYDALVARKGRQRPPGAKARKYRNEPTTIDGQRFDSKREAARWMELRVLERAGQITELQRQVPLALIVNRQNCGSYVSDFRYLDHGLEVFEDVKSPASRTPLYLLKKKLVKAIWNITITEVM